MPQAKKYHKYSRGKKYEHPYYISPIEIGLLWQYEVDFSNEVSNIDLGQEAAKISEVKVGGW